MLKNKLDKLFLTTIIYYIHTKFVVFAFFVCGMYT